MSTFDDILQESGSDEDSTTITFTTESTGRTWTAKRITDAEDFEKIFKRAKKIEGFNKLNTPVTYHSMLPISASVARGIAFMEAALIDVPMKPLEALTLARRRGSYFMEISTSLQAALMGGKVKAEEKAIDALGETSNATDEGETS